MNQPPNDASRRPPPAKPGPVPMHGPAKPTPAAGPPPTSRSSGGNVLVVLLLVFGSVGLLVLLACGGFGWFVYSRARQGEEQVSKARQRAVEARQRAQARRPSPRLSIRPPSPPPVLQRPGRVDSVAAAIAAAKGNDRFRCEEALNYLLSQPVDAAQREAVVKSVVPLLSDPRRSNQAMRVLQRWATADVATLLLPELNNPAVARQGGIRKLLAKFKVDEKLLVAQCVKDLQGADSDRRREATWWLGGHVIVDEQLTPQVSAALIDLLQHDEFRSHAAEALQSWATSQSVPQLIEAAQAAHAARNRLAERDIVQLLARLGDKRAAPVVADYLGTDHDPRTAKEALLAIGPGSADELLVYLHHEDSTVQQTARQLLADWEVPPSKLAAQTVSDLRSGDYDRQREALRWLANSAENEPTQHTAIAEAIVSLLKDARLRNYATSALRKWATPETVPTLIEMLEGNDRRMRSEAERILLAMKDPRAVEPLTRDFGGGDFVKHVAANRNIKALGPIAESAVWPHVTAQKWTLAKEACELLGQIGTRRSLPALELAMQHETRFVREAAEKAIRDIQAADRQVNITAASPPVTGMRIWTDASGANRVEAEFFKFEGGRVQLRLKNGRLVSLQISQLSVDDRRYVMEMARHAAEP